MTKPLELPRHLHVFADELAVLEQRMMAQSTVPMALVDRPINIHQLDTQRHWLQKHLANIADWVQRITDWVNVELNAVLGTESSDAVVRQNVARLSAFVDELAVHRAEMQVLAVTDWMRPVASRLDAVYASLQRQVQAWLSQIVAALQPAAIARAAAGKERLDLAISFELKPDTEMASINHWCAQANAMLEGLDAAEPGEARGSSWLGTFLGVAGLAFLFGLGDDD